MDIGSIFLILALLILVGWFISRPIFEHKPAKTMLASSGQQDHERSSLLAERDRAVNALHELDFDFILGKIPEEDYPSQRSQLLQYGVDILRKLDALQETAPVASPEDRLETAIAARKARSVEAASSSTIQSEDQIEMMISKRKLSQPEKTNGFCHKCGGPIQKSDLFCSKCGASLRA